MRITLELAPEAEARLVAQARDRGLSLAAYVETIIAREADAGGHNDSFRPEGVGNESTDLAVDAVFDTEKIPPGVGEGAMSRESWYR